MKPGERTNRGEKNLVESDEDDGDFSKGSGEEWSPNEEKCGEENGNSSDEQPSTSDDSPFKTTAGFTLKIVKSYKQSKHPVWLMFGYLMRDCKEVSRVKDRFFCKKCFDKKKIKGQCTAYKFRSIQKFHLFFLRRIECGIYFHRVIHSILIGTAPVQVLRV